MSFRRSRAIFFLLALPFTAHAALDHSKLRGDAEKQWKAGDKTLKEFCENPYDRVCKQGNPALAAEKRAEKLKEFQAQRKALEKKILAATEAKLKEREELATLAGKNAASLTGPDRELY